MAKVAGEFSFSDFNKELSKISKFGGIVSEGSISEITEYIPTGNYILNACLTVCHKTCNNHCGTATKVGCTNGCSH